MLVDRFSSVIKTSIVAISAGIVSCITLLVLYGLGYDWAAALRDASLSEKPFAGLISDVGIVMTSVAALAAFSAYQKSKQNRFLSLAIFCFAFAIDDYLMLHERSKVLELAMFACFGVLFLVVYLQFARANRQSDGPGTVFVIPLLAIGASFAFSVIADLGYVKFAELAGLPRRLGYAFEDIPKFIGVSLLLSFSVGEWFRVRA